MFTCYNKKAYHTAEDAGRLIAKIKNKREVKYLRVYACPECGLFHITKQEPKVLHAPQNQRKSFAPTKIN